MRRLTLSDFRCYRHQRIETDRRPVVLTGPNGAGKTNVLEALSFLVPGRGLRQARLGDVTRSVPGDDGDTNRSWAVAATVETPRGAVDIGTGRDAPTEPPRRERRVVRIDGQAARGQAALAEVLNAVWLTPRMDRLFGDAPAARRRFIDRLVFGFDPAHARRVGAFENAQRQRARLLRRERAEGAADPEWLAALENTMAAQGIAVAAARRDMATRLNEVGCRPPGPFPGVAIEMTGPLEDWLGLGPALAAEDRMRDSLAAARRHDADSGTTTVGPHKSDVHVRHLNKGLPAERCSTGEQKALLIALVLADVRLQARDHASLPLLLLDEVAAHLDDRHRQALFDEIADLGAQAWLTGTDSHVFQPLGATGQFFRVEDARVMAA
ncbi:MAG: DNA replication/repair protein RecF [Rhodospirillales bacterium]|jgi:DNA replication and repair protein RecF|nr:DNA replication/repair protein RecF [Rhodospirillales bacterium]